MLQRIQKSAIDASFMSMTRINSAIRPYFLSFKRHGPPEINVKGGYTDILMGIEVTWAGVRKDMHQLEPERLQKKF